MPTLGSRLFSSHVALPAALLVFKSCNWQLEPVFLAKNPNTLPLETPSPHNDTPGA